MDDQRIEKEKALREGLARLGSAVIAFSGGVDSTYLLAEAQEALGDRVAAVTLRLSSMPEKELAEAVSFCRKRGIRHEILDIDQFSIPGFQDNPRDRCYRCKRFLFARLKQWAEDRGIPAVADGTNRDDESGYRPGLRALAELGILSPLRDAGLGKEDIRALSKKAGLPTWKKPAFACLATRFPYGERLTEEKLRRVEAAENFLFDRGLTQLRVRAHGDLARIEALPEEMERLLSLRRETDACFRRLGFSYVTMDLAGYRTGSMDETAGKKPSV